MKAHPLNTESSKETKGLQICRLFVDTYESGKISMQGPDRDYLAALYATMTHMITVYERLLCSVDDCVQRSVVGPYCTHHDKHYDDAAREAYEGAEVFP